MFRHLLKPDGFTVKEVERQIWIEMHTGQNRQNRRTRTARSNREYLYWLANHNFRRLCRAARVSKELVEQVTEESGHLTYSEIAERLREHGAEWHASWILADRVIENLSESEEY